MELSANICNWLKEAKILTKESQPLDNGKHLIDDEDSALLENGLNFMPLIKRLNMIQNKLDRETTPHPAPLSYPSALRYKCTPAIPLTTRKSHLVPLKAK